LLLLRQVRNVVRLQSVHAAASRGRVIEAHHVHRNVVLLNHDARIAHHPVSKSALPHPQVDQLLYVALPHPQVDQLLYVALPHLRRWPSHILNVLVIQELVHHVLRSAVLRALLLKSPTATLLPLPRRNRLVLPRLGKVLVRSAFATICGCRCHLSSRLSSAYCPLLVCQSPILHCLRHGGKIAVLAQLRIQVECGPIAVDRGLGARAAIGLVAQQSDLLLLS
jgi:hypothetical protein